MRLRFYRLCEVVNGLEALRSPRRGNFLRLVGESGVGDLDSADFFRLMDGRTAQLRCFSSQCIEIRRIVPFAERG